MNQQQIRVHQLIGVLATYFHCHDEARPLVRIHLYQKFIKVESKSVSDQVVHKAIKRG